MRKRFLVPALAAAVVAGALIAAVTPPVIEWKTGDRTRPAPPKLTPPTPSTQEHAGSPPSDAVVLFDGSNILAWEGKDGGIANWTVKDGYLEVKPGSGPIRTKLAFGDCQLHVEWATPDPSKGKDQEPGNSGVFLQTLYEIQVLESSSNVTYADGQAAAIYCQYPPLVNASLPPGKWQTYDVVFHGPRFDTDGSLTRLATVTLFHNGVLVQDHVQLTGPTDYMKRPPYKKGADTMPLELQDHGQPVRYRNIWIREL